MMQEPPATSNLLHTAALVLLLAFSNLVHGTPGINLPINAQVPPVARPNHAYSFVFSDSTFSWAGNSIDYSLTNYSGWLQLDSSSRAFSGTPGYADAGSVTVALAATDESGSSSMSVTFVVSADSGPGLGTSVAEQLPAFGPVPSPDSLSLAPSSALSLSFSPNTFTNTNASTVYYAICANNTPLPSWVNFHPSSLTFSGTTPSSTSPWELPQAFRIQLIASNVLGFGEAVASFQLVITNHLLTFRNSLHVVNITNGVPVDFHGLWGDLTLDGQPANSSDIRQIAASTPPWMSFNSSTMTLSGTPPTSVASQNFTVTASDIYGDTTSTVVLIQDNGNLTDAFTGPFAAVNATIGANFTYDLNSEIVSNSTADVAVTLGAASIWLNFNSTSLELQGHVPTDLKPQSVQIMVTSAQGSQSQSQNLTINIQSASAPSARTTNSHSISPKATSGSTAGGNRNVNAAGSAGKPRKRWIAAAVLVPIILALGCLLLLCFCLKRRRRRKAEKDQSRSPRWKISRPIQEKDTPNFDVQEETTGVLAINEKQASPRASKAPWPDFLGYQTSGHSNRGSKLRVLSEATGSIGHSIAPDSSGFPFPGWAKGKSAVPEVSLISEKHIPRRTGKASCGLNAPPLAVQRLSVVVDNSPTKRNSKQKRRVSSSSHDTTSVFSNQRQNSKQKKRQSSLSHDTTSVFSNQRRSGLGHGRITLSRNSSNFRFSSKGVGHGNGLTSGPPGFGIVRNSWRNLSRSTWTSTDASSEPGVEREATIGRYQSNSRPPTSNTFGKGSHSHVIREVPDDEGLRKPTLRPVLSSTKSSIRRKSPSPSRLKSEFLKVDPLQSFHKRRLQQRSSRNPLFSAGPSSSRLSSIRGSKTAPLERTASQSGGTDNNTLSERPITPQREDPRRSYSESSSLDPPVRPTPSRSFGSTTPPRRQKSYIRYQLNARALSPPKSNRPLHMNSRGSSWVSTSSDSKFGSAASDAAPPPFTTTGFGDDLREETDENGNKRWLRGHPNPLGTHGLDVTDQELIDRLRVSGHVGAAQRLSYLMRAQQPVDPFGADESANEGRQLKIGSMKGKRLGLKKAGLRQGDPVNLSMRGDISNTTAGSAFI